MCGSGAMSTILDPANFAGKRPGGMSMKNAIDPGGAIIEKTTGSGIGHKVADPLNVINKIAPENTPLEAAPIDKNKYMRESFPQNKRAKKLYGNKSGPLF